PGPIVLEDVALDVQPAGVGGRDRRVAARLADVDGTGRETLVALALLDGVADEGVTDDFGVVADLVPQALAAVVRDVVALTQEAGVVGVHPQAGRVDVVMDVVAGDHDVAVLPELAAALSAALGLHGVVARHVVAGKGDVGRAAGERRAVG